MQYSPGLLCVSSVDVCAVEGVVLLGERAGLVQCTGTDDPLCAGGDDICSTWEVADFPSSGSDLL